MPWKGVTVKADTPEEIVALYQCREVMEGLGARLCARHATPEQVAELKELCKEMHAIEDATARVEVNSRFHSMIAQFSGNDRVVDYLADFRERVNRDMYLSSFNAVRTHDCDDEHDHIVDAIDVTTKWPQKMRCVNISIMHLSLSGLMRSYKIRN